MPAEKVVVSKPVTIAKKEEPGAIIITKEKIPEVRTATISNLPAYKIVISTDKALQKMIKDGIASA